MTKKVITLVLFLFTSPVFGGQDVVIVKGHALAPYDKAIKGFNSACGCTISEIVSSEMDDASVVREIRRIKPRVIFAVGAQALSAVKEIKTLPVVYAMVPNPQPLLSDKENVYGVSMNIAPELYFNELKKILPGANRIAVLYNPAKTGHYVDKAAAAALPLGITLITREVSAARDVPAVIQDIKDELQVLWLLPDSTVITPETIEYLLFFSFESKVPILAFAQKYVQMGALMSLGIDDYETGRQAGEMAKQVLAGRAPHNVAGGVPPQKAVLTINIRSARKMSIPLSEEVVGRAKIVQ
jgi:putative ABC transport system substrate-binding protein